MAKNYFISKQAKQLVESNKQLQQILKKYKITDKRHCRVMQLLAAGIDHKDMEEYYLKGKDSLIKTAQIDLDALRKDIETLLDGVPTYDPMLTAEKKKLCKDIIEAATKTELARRYLTEDIKKITGKRTISSMEANPKILKIYADLIKELVNLLNPIFRTRFHDWDKVRTLRKEKTFVATSEILNAVFNLDIAPAQVKARYHR